MPIRYSYDELTIYRRADGTLGWVHVRHPGIIWTRRGTHVEPPGSVVTSSDGTGMVPEGAVETAHYGPVAGAAAGERDWDHRTLCPPDSPERVAGDWLVDAVWNAVYAHHTLIAPPEPEDVLTVMPPVA